MKKIIVLFIPFLLFSSSLEDSKKLVDRFMNYKVKLNHTYNPFYDKKRYVNVEIPEFLEYQQPEEGKKPVKKLSKRMPRKEAKIKKRNKDIHLSLISILNDKVLLEMGGKGGFIQSFTIGDKIDGYILKRVIDNDTILLIKGNKKRIIKMNKINIKMKVVR